MFKISIKLSLASLLMKNFFAITETVVNIVIPLGKFNINILMFSEKPLLKYKPILINHSKEVNLELQKEENIGHEISEVLNMLSLKKQFKV